MTAGELFAALFSYAIQAWAIVLVAVLIGRYIRKGARMPASGWKKTRLIFVAYAATVSSMLILQAVGTSPLYSFIIPIVAGAVAARSLMDQSLISSKEI